MGPAARGGRRLDAGQLQTAAPTAAGSVDTKREPPQPIHSPTFVDERVSQSMVNRKPPLPPTTGEIFYDQTKFFKEKSEVGSS